MMETEISPSSRARCHLCKLKIQKGTLRVRDYGYYSWPFSDTPAFFHPKCWLIRNWKYLKEVLKAVVPREAIRDLIYYMEGDEAEVMTSE